MTATFARSPLVVDALAAAGVGAVSVAALLLADEPGARSADGGAYALLVAAAVPLVLRRRWPRAVLGVVAGAAIVSFALGYPGGPVTIPLMAAIYVTAAAGQRWWAWLAATLFAGVGAVVRGVVEGDPLVSVALNSALFVLVALLGDAVDSRRALRREVDARLRRAEAEREREAQRRVRDERTRIARELHDVMAHTIATMTVQAGAAADALDDSPEEARTALCTINDSGRQAMGELRATVSLLRDGPQPTPRPPAPGLAELPALVDAAAGEGLATSLCSTVDDQRLPAATQLTVYRIVQEALTNVIRHAHASAVTVSVDPHAGEVVVAVDDDGRGAAANDDDGFGLQGMRERAEALGGRLTAGPGTAGGYRVEARLPNGDAQP